MVLKVTKTRSLYPLLSTITFIVTLMVNYGSAFGWFGATQQDISNLYRNLLTPAGYTFSIWGIIYSLIILFLGYQFYLQHQNRYNSSLFNPLNFYFIISCVFNIMWNVSWVNNLIVFSTMWIFLLTIVLAFECIYILRKNFLTYSQLIPITFALYLGWLVIATITNVAAWLVHINWGMWGLPEHFWACLVYIFIAFLAGVLLYVVRNPIFNLPIIWGLMGILSTLLNASQIETIHAAMPYVVIGVMIVLLFQAFIAFKNNGYRLLPK